MESAGVNCNLKCLKSKMALKVLLILGVLSFVTCSNKIDRSREAIDSSFLENVLDEEECDRQITALISSQSHLLQFMDAGIRIPRGVYTGNLVDLGNYHQCLTMEQQFQGVEIEGKYCTILIPMEQDENLLRQDMRGFHFDPRSLRLDNETISKIEEYNLGRIELLALSGRLDGLQHERSTEPLVFRLGVCIPKPCTAKQAIDSVYNITDELGLHYYEDYCRLPGDKTWVPADYTAVCIFVALGLLTFFSTCYDLFYRFLMNKDVNQISKLVRSFSVYTNGKRLTTFCDGGGTLQCVDGIRTLTVLWVIVGHAYNSESFIANPFDLEEWKFSIRALWITGATMTVDTFFTVTGVLLVYTTAGKITPKTFLKNLHWFYLYRYIRLTPLLAVAVLLQASFFNRIADGPYWQSVAYATETCRTNWWTTLLHVQNLVNPEDMCIPHAWYVAIEFQLFVISPLVLLWVLSGKKLYAWIAVIGALVLVIGGATIYTFHINVPGGNLVPSRLPELADYLRKYYFFTLTRAAPFFVGLVFGYLLHLYRHKKLYLPWPIAILFWVNALGILGGIFYFKYSIKQYDWENELMDNLMNSLMRPAYACVICWIITACVHGYGGPINWLLSHEVWRLPARLTYGMYLFHYPLMFTINGAAVSPTFFSVEGLAFKFVSHTVVAFVWSFFLTLLVDSPITVLIKQLMGSATTITPIMKIDDPAEEDMEETLDSTAAIQKNMETLDEEDDEIIESDDANSEIDDNLSQSSSNNGDSVSDDIASEAESNDVNPEPSQPNEAKSNTNGRAVEPGGSGIGSSNKINEQTMASVHSKDETIDPSIARNNSSDIDVEANAVSIDASDRVEPSTSRSNSQLKIVEPNATSINPSNTFVEPSTSPVKSSDKTAEPMSARKNSSNRNVEANTASVNTSVIEPSMSRTDSSGNVNIEVDSSTNFISESAPDIVANAK